MDVSDQLHAVRSGSLSRRAFNKTLLGAGVALVTAPVASKMATAAAADQATFFTWGGFDVKEIYGSYIEKHGETPNFSISGGSEEALTKIRGGFVVDVAHPCNQAIPRWIASGLFQQIDTSRLTDWDDIVPELINLEGNVVDGKPYLAPFDWGQTSVTYRTDLYDLQGMEESWSMLWDERYKGRMGVLASAGDTWWVAAIYAGVDFKDIATEAAFKKTAALLRKQRPLIRLYTDDVTTLEQALASGEMVAAMTWNDSAARLKSQGVSVAFAKPKEGALTWVCGAMIHKDAPNLDRAYDVINALLSVETGKFLIGDYGLGHSNAKSFDTFTDDQLSDLGLARDASEILASSKFQIPQTQEFESKINQEFEQIKAGF